MEITFKQIAGLIARRIVFNLAMATGWSADSEWASSSLVRART